MKAIAKNLLLAFVLITVGFALGKEVTVRRQSDASANAAGSNTELTTQNSELKVIVYYLHATFRCVTCNEIERLTKTLLDTEFADHVAASKVEWREADFQQDESVAKRYGVVSSCVVVVKVRDGKEAAYQRLDDVWTRYRDPSDFNRYVGSAIRKHLEDQ